MKERGGTDRTMSIRFFHPKGKNGWLSNFSPHRIIANGATWPTAEHLYQALKFPCDPERQRRIREAGHPGAAKEIAHEPGAPIGADWESRKVDVMRQVLRLKFAQHADLRERLMQTGDERLVEHRTRDAFWGDGGDDSGQNMLGRLLMEIRKELKAAGGMGGGRITSRASTQKRSLLPKDVWPNRVRR